LAAGAGGKPLLAAWIAPFARRRRSRIDAVCPNCRHARDCMTRYLCRHRLRRLASFCRDEGSPPHHGFGGAAVHGRHRALPRARFLLEVTASQAILTIEAPDRDGLLEMLLPQDALIRR
jgi:hypothetical protein